MEKSKYADYLELGSLGLKASYGFITEAVHTKLTWPSVQPVYSKMRRSDPEVAIIRQFFSSLASDLKLYFEVDKEYAERGPEKHALEFANSLLTDIEDGPETFIDTLVSNIPFFGWGWWEVLPGLRLKGWRPPDENYPWRSEYNDGRIGIRRLAWRDTSSFARWDMDDKTGRLYGMIQQDYPNPEVKIPLDRSLHITFGDAHNPEGLTPLEAMWRLERIKYGLEVVMGIGFEHAAGHLNINVDKQQITQDDKNYIKEAAKGIMTAQESNYAVWPQGIDGQVISTPFAAAESILATIKYYSTLKFMLYNMQFIVMSTISDTGSYAAETDSSALVISSFNSMMQGAIKQADSQIGKRIFQWNDFPGLERRPELKITKIDKKIALEKLGQFTQLFASIADLTEGDIRDLRNKSGVFQETPEGEVVRPAGGLADKQPQEAPQQQQTSKPGAAVKLSHEAEVVNRKCPLCGGSQAWSYPDHKGLLVCASCAKTYDPEVE